MVLIATLALMVVWLVGKATENKGRHRDYQANSIKDTRVLSIIFLGLAVMNDWRVSFTVNEFDAAWKNLDESIQQQCYIE